MSKHVSFKDDNGWPWIENKALQNELSKESL